MHVKAAIPWLVNVCKHLHERHCAGSMLGDESTMLLTYVM